MEKIQLWKLFHPQESVLSCQVSELCQFNVLAAQEPTELRACFFQPQESVLSYQDSVYSTHTIKVQVYITEDFLDQ